MNALRICLTSLLVGLLASRGVGEEKKAKPDVDREGAPTRVSIGKGDIPTRDFLGLFADVNGMPVLIEAADSPKLSESIAVVAPIQNAGDALLREMLRANGWFVRRDVLPDGKAVLRVSKTGSALPDLDTSTRRIIITGAGKTPGSKARTPETRDRRRPRGTRRLRVFELRHREIESFARLLVSIFSPPDGSTGEGESKLESPTMLGPVRIIADHPTRQIVVEAWHAEDLEAVEGIIQNLDRPETNPLVTLTYRARHQEASLLAEALRPIYGESSAGGDPLIVPAEGTNSLVLRFPRERHEEVLRVLKILDDPRVSLAGLRAPKPAKKPAPRER